MLDAGIWIAAAVAVLLVVAVLGAVLKLLGWILHGLVALLLLPLQILGALLGLVGGLLLLPVLLVGLVLGAVGLAAGILVVPLLPFALVGLCIWGIWRHGRHHRARAR